MIPFEITVAVNFQTVQTFNWQGGLLALTVPFLATGFGIFLLRQAFLQIPKELREGSHHRRLCPLGFLWRVALRWRGR